MAEEPLIDTQAIDSSEFFSKADPVTSQTSPPGEANVDMDKKKRPKFRRYGQSSHKDRDPTPLVFKQEIRKVQVPEHRLAALKKSWPQIYTPLVENLNLQVKFAPAQKTVFLRSHKGTTEPGALQKGEDFVRAFMMGFAVEDAIAVSVSTKHLEEGQG
jgi:RNA-binding protein PNO1